MYKVVKVFLISMLTWAIYSYKAQADQEDQYHRVGVKLGISSASFWDCWKHLEKEHFEIEGAVEKGNFFGKPKFFGIFYWESGSGYFGWEMGLGYLCQGGILNLAKQPGMQSASYLKITQHTITIPVGLCIYPLKLEEDEGIWKIVGGFVLNIIPKRIWMVKKPDQDSEEKASLSREVGTLLERQNVDLAFYLGTGYEWVCGLSVDVRGTIGICSLLRTQHHKEDAYNTPALENANKAYRRLYDKCRKMKNYYFTFTLGYNLFKWGYIKSSDYQIV